MTTALLIEKLLSTTDGVEFDRIVRKLRKCKPQERESVITAFLRYMQTGQLTHWRELIIPTAIELIQNGESQYAQMFQEGLTDETTAYWAVLGLAKCLGKDCYGTLAAFALHDIHDVEARAHAIKVLADLSNQTFTAGLPSDPGAWDADSLPLTSIIHWRDKGFPDGLGFEEPCVSPALANPQTEIDKLAAKLERKLKGYRSKDHDPANPTNWLITPNQNHLRELNSRWALPALYLEFITKFSPLGVTIYGKNCGDGISLYGAGELIEAQDGYSYNPVTSAAIKDWNRNHVVIASQSGDPYVLDLAAERDGDCPVLTAPHGHGSWRFKQSTATFSTFLQRLA
jgi:hypothetical protein